MDIVEIIKNLKIDLFNFVLIITEDNNKINDSWESWLTKMFICAEPKKDNINSFDLNNKKTIINVPVDGIFWFLAINKGGKTALDNKINKEKNKIALQ